MTWNASISVATSFDATDVAQAAVATDRMNEAVRQAVEEEGLRSSGENNLS